MGIKRSIAFGIVAAGLLGIHAQAPSDPVMKARAQRAQAQGIAEGDLPPVPKGVIEPPPLPPPETSIKDLRKGKRGATQAKSKSKSKKKKIGRKAPGKRSGGEKRLR